MFFQCFIAKYERARTDDIVSHKSLLQNSAWNGRGIGRRKTKLTRDVWIWG